MSIHKTTKWDNFDVNLETVSGADSVRHTYGICYQNISSTIQVPQKITETTYKKKRKIKDVSLVLKEIVKWNYRHVEKTPKCLILNLLK